MYIGPQATTTRRRGQRPGCRHINPTVLRPPFILFAQHQDLGPIAPHGDIDRRSAALDAVSVGRREGLIQQLGQLTTSARRFVERVSRVLRARAEPGNVLALRETPRASPFTSGCRCETPDRTSALIARGVLTSRQTVTLNALPQHERPPMAREEPGRLPWHGPCFGGRHIRARWLCVDGAIGLSFSWAWCQQDAMGLSSLTTRVAVTLSWGPGLERSSKTRRGYPDTS